jgi:hypothetical protein
MTTEGKIMHRILTVLVTAVLAGVLLVPAAIAAKPTDDTTIKATIDAYVVANPMDFEGIDALVYQLRGVHIAVRGDGDTADISAAEAAARVKAVADAEARARAAADSADVVILSGIPAPQRYITKIVISNGVQFWGTWDFPDSWAGQGAPVDIAAVAISASTCTKMQNQAIWTYKTGGGSTGLGSLRGMHPGSDVQWNVADYTTNFTSMADRGTTRIEVVRTSACSSTGKNIGAAVSISLGALSVSYSNAGLNDSFGTAAIYQII